ncbi:hypothetical protein [Lacticaseibacillus hulanensis]|uniref:hypothetical protein n=1 Tax=Lacticaseibacillus hulanensis TaxID=2493111 RepID=UPI000FD735A2|nr:hypothetical protein [Lacticaseibacillus hulanensis]
MRIKIKRFPLTLLTLSVSYTLHVQRFPDTNTPLTAGRAFVLGVCVLVFALYLTSYNNQGKYGFIFTELVWHAFAYGGILALFHQCDALSTGPGVIVPIILALVLEACALVGIYRHFKGLKTPPES